MARHVIILVGLIAWARLQPPPEHWLPIVLVLLEAPAVVLLIAVSLRNGKPVKPPAPNPDGTAESN